MSKGKIDARRKILSTLNACRMDDASSIITKRVIDFLHDQLELMPDQKVLTYSARQSSYEIPMDSALAEVFSDNIDFLQNCHDAKMPSASYRLILMPLLGFNTRGYRLGHGGGWYDKFLINQPQAIKVGIGYAIQQIDFQEEPHDIKMDFVITEKVVYKFSQM